LAYGLRPELVPSIYEVFLPENLRALPIVLDAKHLESSLCQALNACAKLGQKPAEMLRLICLKCRAPYLTDSRLQPALEALACAREADATSHSWWEHLQGPDQSLEDDVGIRLKMSEYLCLTTHLEALALLEGRQTEDQCFAFSLRFTRVLVDALTLLREKGEFSMVFVPETTDAA